DALDALGRVVQVEGRRHLFFQHNPNGLEWGDISWGHAVSDDLVTWQELPVAIPVADDHMIFSGSAAALPDGSIAAFYTGHRHDDDPLRVRQDQRIAVSRDGGATFEPFGADPVIDLDLVDFRDPNVFWHAPTERWVMVVSLPDRRQVIVFGTTDLVTWGECSRFGPAGATIGIWECPALFELPVLDRERRCTATRWVLKIDHNPGHVSGGSGGQYFVGDFDGFTFVPDHPTTEPRWVDWGADFYGALPFAGEPSTNERTWIAWMSNWDYAHDTPTSPWRGAMSLPRRIALVERAGEHVLVQRPVDALDHPSGTATESVGSVASSGRGTARWWGDAADPTPSVVEVADAYRLRLLVGGAGVTIRLGFGGDTAVTVSFDRGAQTLTVDRSASGEYPNERFSGIHSAPVPTDGPLDLDVVVDRSSVEVFADQGAVVFTELIFPPAGRRTVTITGADPGSIRLDSLV
ncbi:MAG: glycoside hydrolase family 32 protein, partial [Ilumatobacter fluminis]